MSSYINLFLGVYLCVSLSFVCPLTTSCDILVITIATVLYVDAERAHGTVHHLGPQLCHVRDDRFVICVEVTCA